MARSSFVLLRRCVTLPRTLSKYEAARQAFVRVLARFHREVTAASVDRVPLAGILTQAVVELADGDAQLGGGELAVAAVAVQRSQDVHALDVFQRAVDDVE